MTKMAAMPIYGKNPSKIIFSETNRLISRKLGVRHRWLKYSNVYINHDPVMTLTKSMARSTWVACASELGKLLKCHLKEKANRKLANGQNIEDSEKRKWPKGLSAPALELNTIIFKHVYWYMQLISGERLQDHWSSGFTSSDQSRYTLWSCQNVRDALSYLLDSIYIRFGTKLYRQIVGIPMGTNCAPLVADLFLYCYERDFMDALNHDNQADVIEAFNSTSRYLDDLLNIDNPYFEGMVNQIYPPELQLNKDNISDTEAPFLDLHLSVANGFVSSKIYDKRDDFDFDIVNFPFLDGDVPRRASYGVYISQLIRFARVCNHVTDFNARNKCLTAKLLQQGYRYHKL